MAETDSVTIDLIQTLDHACRLYGFRDYMPDPMIGLYVKQAIRSSFREGRVDLDQFYSWVRRERSVPDHVFAKTFSTLAERAKELGVELAYPPGFDPGFDELIKGYLRYEYQASEIDTPRLDRHYGGGEAGFARAVTAELSGRIAADEVELVVEVVAAGEEDNGPAPLDLAPLPEAEEAPPAAEPATEPVVELAVEAAAEALDPLPGPALLEREEGVEELRLDGRGELIFATGGPWLEGPEASPSESAEVEEVAPPAAAAVSLEAGAESAPEAIEELGAEAVAPPVPAGPPPSALPEEHGEAMEQELMASLADELRLDARARLESRLRFELLEEVRIELREELRDEVREEVKRDLMLLLRPAVEAELRKGFEAEEVMEVMGPGDDGPLDHDFVRAAVGGPEAGGETDALAAGRPEPGRGSGLNAEEQLTIIRRVRERLGPRIEERFARDLTELARVLDEKRLKEAREDRLRDPSHCRGLIRDFLFPEQPKLWAKVERLVDPEEWRSVARLIEAGGDHFLDEKLGRSRKVMRETLLLKADIEEELVSHGRRDETQARTRELGVRKLLAGADEVLNFALKSIAGALELEDPRPKIN